MADARRSVYSVRRRGRKWWVNLFYWAIDVAVVNAYVCYRFVHQLAEKDMEERVVVGRR